MGMNKNEISYHNFSVDPSLIEQEKCRQYAALQFYFNLSKNWISYFPFRILVKSKKQHVLEISTKRWIFVDKSRLFGNM